MKMLAAEVLSDEPNQKNSHKKRSQPLLQSGICSKIIVNLPPTPSATRHESLSRRSRRNGKLSFSSASSSSQQVSKLDGFRKDSFVDLKNLGLLVESERLVWMEWYAGEEYSQDLVLKNVAVQPLKIRYSPPSTQFFSTLFPQLILLSPGTSLTLPVLFRPLEKVSYEDRIQFTTSLGPFYVQLQGHLPQYSINIPESIHFGLSAVNLCGQLQFQLQNTSELVTSFTWKVPKPFVISPVSGALEPKSSCDLRATFCPTSAVVFKATAVCTYGENLKTTLNMDGIGKFPHLVLTSEANLTSKNCDNQTVITFKSVKIHHVENKDLYLHNVTNVAASYSIRRYPKMMQSESVFVCKKKRGLIDPMQREKITIGYSPHIGNVTDFAHFKVTTAGGVTSSKFQCVGFCEGPNIMVSSSLVDFGILLPGEDSSIKTLELTNKSSCDAIFQFGLDDEVGVFCVDIVSGLLPHRKSKTIKISFEPSYCINYYRRAALFVHEQAPIFIDLIGTKHSDLIRPPHLLAEHLFRYHILVSRGLSFYSPHNVQSQLKEGKIVLDDFDIPMLPDETGLKLEERFYTNPMEEYFDDGHHTETTINPPHVSLDQMYIWMGGVEALGNSLVSWHTNIRVNNHTYGKVEAVWIPDASGMFKVYPATAEVLPFKSYEFKITFKPLSPDQFIKQQLECYVAYKCLRDYRIVESKFVIPPWLLTVDIVGHTYNKHLTVYPQLEVRQPKLVFPPVPRENGSFQTLVVESEEPVLYQILKNHGDCVAKPPFNVTSSKYHINTIRFIPEKLGVLKDKFTIRFNDDDRHNKIIEMMGSGEQPELLLSNEGEFFFKPTCIYSVTVRGYEIHNIGRFPVGFKWLISKEDQDKLFVQPEEGLVLANQTQEHQWTFAPTCCADHHFIVHCLAWSDFHSDIRQENDGRDAKKFKLRINAKCIRGEIRVERSDIDFGSVIVGSSKTETIVLHNDFLCDLHFRFALKQVIDNEYGEEPDLKEPIGLALGAMSSIVPARSRLEIDAHAHAHRRVIYSWFLYYDQLTSSGAVFPSSKQSLLCQLFAEGIYPSLSVIDLRSNDKGKIISRSQLRKWFNIDSFNMYLDCDPEKAELMHSVAMKRRSAIKPNLYTNSIVTFNFGAAPLSAQSCFVNMTFKNTSSLACRWEFFFPKDLQMDLDSWAVDGLMDSTELHYTLIESNELFTVSPKCGVLNPEEKSTVLLSYKHDIVGTHRIPVLFKIDNGKEILLLFVGVTVEPGRRYLHFPETQHNFAPVSVGERLPPKQIYEVHNGGSVPVVFNVDLSSLHELRANNFDHNIFSCLNPCGRILPQQSHVLEWIFSPLESKTYEADVRIHVSDGETAVITFKGAGYDRRDMGKSEPVLSQLAFKKLALRLEDRLTPQEQAEAGIAEVQSKLGGGTRDLPMTPVIVIVLIVTLSCEYISFGNVPVFGRIRRIVFLKNTSEDKPVFYSWHTTSEITNKILSISPVQGNLKPGQSSICHVTFCGIGPPSFFNINMICEVIDLKAMAEYRAELDAWERECERQTVEFCITSQTALASGDPGANLASSISKTAGKFLKKGHLENTLNATPPVHLTEQESEIEHSLQLEYKTFRTLPPIKMELDYGMRCNRESMKRKREVAFKYDWPRPQPPEPVHFQLTVTARTHDVTTFRRHFPQDCDIHFIDRTLQFDSTATTSPDCEMEMLRKCCENEEIMLKMILAEIIRGLLDDNTFQDAICGLDSKPYPFFRQLPRDQITYEEEMQFDKNDQPRLSILFVDEETPGLAANANVTPLIGEILHSDDAQSQASLTANATKGTGLTFSEANGSFWDEIEKAPRVFDEEEIKSHPSFAVMLDSIFTEIVSNLMEEAMYGEVLLTVRPRAVALPPVNTFDLRKSYTNTDVSISPVPPKNNTLQHLLTPTITT